MTSREKSDPSGVQMSVTRHMPSLTLRASFVPGSIDEDKRTVDLVWTTGARVRRGFWDPYWEELEVSKKAIRMDRLASGGAPLLNAHRGDSLDDVLGIVEKASIKARDREGRATVRFARAEDHPDAEAIFRRVKDGIIRNVSVGYRIHKMEKVSEGEDQLPVFRAVDWEPYEISLVPMGADSGAGVRAASADTNPCEFIEGDMAVTEDKERAAGAETETPLPVITEDERRRIADAAVAADHERIDAMRNIGASLRLPDAFVQEHISSRTALDDFRRMAIDKRADMDKETQVIPDIGRARIAAGEDERDKWIRGNSHWLIQRAGPRVVETFEAASKKSGDNERVAPGEFRGQSVFDIAREYLERVGVRTRGLTRTEVAGLAMSHRSGGYNTTSDFAVLLENTLHKVLLASYEITDDTWSLFCATGSVSDFRPHPRYKTGFLGRLRRVNEHGELTRENIPDGEKEVISAETKGYELAYTREMIINDDMGWLNRLAMNLGRSARLSIEADVYDTLALNGGLGPDMNDGNPLFDASHNNIGTASDLTVAGIEADRVLMGRQKDPANKEYLTLRPQVLLVPDSLGAQARVVNDAQYDTDAVDPGTNEANKFQKPNVVRGLFRNIVDTPRLSGTRRYLFANPMVNAALEVAFLDGQQQPQIESMDGWSMLGVKWRIYIDYGIAGVDWRGAVTNEGN